jgi:hypothetical protein
MKRSLVGTALAFVVTATIATAQQPQTPPRATPETPPPPSMPAQRPDTKLVGCLYREDQVPGRKPNVAERAGVLEDYILAGAMKAGTTAKLATGNMYKVEGPADEKLKALVGKKVEVIGRIDPEGGPGAPGTPRPDRGPGPDAINLPEFEASAISEVSGSCPATPVPRS